MEITHQFLKELVPALVFVLYLMSRIRPKIDPVFRAMFFIQVALIFSWPVIVFLKVPSLLAGSWRLGISFFQYLSFAFIISLITYYRTNKMNYSVTLSIILTSASGYLYEVPRFLKIQGIVGLFRFNKYSPLVFDLQIFFVLLIPALLLFRGIRIDLKTSLAFYNYWAYSYVYYHFFDELIFIRRWSRFWIFIPHIVIFRLPIMILFIVLVNQINYKSRRSNEVDQE